MCAFLRPLTSIAIAELFENKTLVAFLSNRYDEMLGISSEEPSTNPMKFIFQKRVVKSILDGLSSKPIRADCDLLSKSKYIIIGFPSGGAVNGFV